MSFLVPLNCWIGLVDAATLEEVVGAGYARQPATFVTTADGTAIANTATLQWCPAQQDWGTSDGVDLWDAPTGGALIATIAADPTDIPQYAIARLRAGSLVIAGSPYGVGPYGVGPYATLPSSTIIEITFGAPAFVASPGTWAPANVCGCCPQQQAA